MNATPPSSSPKNKAVTRSANAWGARIVPVLIVAIVGYATWVTVVSIAIYHLIDGAPRQVGAGVAIIVIYFVLLLASAVAFFRTLGTVVTTPGFVPPPAIPRKTLPKETSSSESSSESNEKEYLDRAAVHNGSLEIPSGLELFAMRDMYECEMDGLPRWCPTCKNWKPDRSHHCSEVGRCVYKMDHYCPWAGGVVSETNFKFFIQFVFYTALYCTLVLVVSAYYVSTLHRIPEGSEINWCILIGLAGLFTSFTWSMVLNSGRFALINSSTIENLSRGSRQYSFAVLVSDTAVASSPADEQKLQQLGARGIQTVSFPLTPAGSEPAPGPRRTFAVLMAPLGDNVYDIGSPMQNWKSVMGGTVLEWLLPVRHSPCFSHRRALCSGEVVTGTPNTFYATGPAFERMKATAGL